jgi:hypothetical protein
MYHISSTKHEIRIAACWSLLIEISREVIAGERNVSLDEDPITVKPLTAEWIEIWKYEVRRLVHSLCGEASYRIRRI